MVDNNKKELLKSEQLAKIIEYLQSGAFREDCIGNFDIEPEVYDKYVSHSVADLFDSLTEVQDELHTTELLEQQDAEFLDSMDDLPEYDQHTN